MMSRYEINSSDDEKIQNAILLDSQGRKTMNALNLKAFRSTKNRSQDRKIAVQKYRNVVDLKQYAIHHTLSGLVLLVPRQLHEEFKHDGYFKRLNS